MLYKEIRYLSKVTGTYRCANVLLPAGYDKAKYYPVLYLLHGIGGDQNEWKAAKPEKICADLLREKRDVMIQQSPVCPWEDGNRCTLG